MQRIQILSRYQACCIYSRGYPDYVCFNDHWSMSTFEIIMTCIGFLLCVMVLALVTITIFGIVWWVFKTEVDITPENDKEIEV